MTPAEASTRVASDRSEAQRGKLRANGVLEQAVSEGRIVTEDGMGKGVAHGMRRY
jgi:hypothetical protein